MINAKYTSPVVTIITENETIITSRDLVSLSGYEKIGISSAGIEWYIPVGSSLKSEAKIRLAALEQVYERINNE